jgi:DNA replicative helicase MCM subunit Mcm2 (Cdc46/Mcm family)
MHRPHTGQQGHLVVIPPWGRRPLGIGVTAATTDAQHLTPHRQRPGRLVLHDEGIAHVDALAKKPRAFVHLSRSIRQRLFSARNR